MATYKQATKVASPVVGEMPVKDALKANISVANQRSNPYPATKTSGINSSIGFDFVDQCDGGQRGNRHARHAKRITATRSGRMGQALERLDKTDRRQQIQQSDKIHAHH